jgi:hypothetical protein
MLNLEHHLIQHSVVVAANTILHPAPLAALKFKESQSVSASVPTLQNLA